MEQPLIELGAPVLGDAERRALAEVVDDGWLTMGDRVRRFEQSFAELHEVADAVAVNSATAALQLSLAAFDVGPGAEVLVPSMSFVATAATVVHAGATPVFVDIEAPDRPHMSLADARRRITADTRAIVLMHYGGYWVDVPAWRELADEYGLLLFEDAAHAAGLVGAVGTLSDAASFSFFTNKNMTTAEGGMMIVADEGRRARARLLRAHGMTSGTVERTRGHGGYDVVECGFNFRMDELRAAIGLVQLPQLLGWNKIRCDLVRRYRSLLHRELPQVAVPFDADHLTAGHLMAVVLPEGCDRDAVRAAMRASGVQTSNHYPPIHRLDYYRRTTGTPSLPHTESFGARELTLPLHPGLQQDDTDRVVAALGAALGTPT